MIVVGQLIGSVSNDMLIFTYNSKTKRWFGPLTWRFGGGHFGRIHDITGTSLADLRMVDERTDGTDLRVRAWVVGLK